MGETEDSKLSGDKMISMPAPDSVVGKNTTAVWLSFIITPNRFPKANTVAAYFSLCSVLKINAQKITSTDKRIGNKQLHTMQCMCTTILV